MPETFLKIVRIFVGSPSGLDIERQTAKRIVDEINQSHSDHWGCQLKLIGWEETFPGYRRAQSLINQDLDSCDYFIGLVWNHWGSKPDDGDSKYTSGFHEEFERAKERTENGLMKNISLFFKQIPEVQLKDMGPSVAQVIAFKQECISRRKPLFKEFKEATDFERQLRPTLERIGWEEAEITRPKGDNLVAEQSSKDSQTNLDDDGAPDRLFGTNGVKFLQKLINDTSPWHAASPHEIARLRLLGLCNKQARNDDTFLGPHDANLIFEKRYEFAFDEREKRALAAAGITRLLNHNAPLWHWLSVLPDGEQFRGIALSAVFGSAAEKQNSIRILQATGQSTPDFGEYYTRERILKYWLYEPIADTDLKPVMEFLRSNGETADVEILDKLVAEAPPSRQGAIAETAAFIVAKIDAVDALRRLIEADVDPISSELTDKIFSYKLSIPSELLQRCLTLKSERLRSYAVEVLAARGEVDIPTAERLLSDTELSTRLTALDVLAKENHLPDEATIRKILVRQKPGGFFGGLFGAANQADDSYYQRFREKRLASLPYSELRDRVVQTDISDTIPLLTMYRGYRSKSLGEIRANLADGFLGYITAGLETIKGWHGEDSTESRMAVQKSDALRKTLTAKSLDILCQSLVPTDLNLVRRTLDLNPVDFSRSILKYLARFGDWSDRDRIIAFGTPQSDLMLLIPSLPEEQLADTAKALYAVGKQRLADLLQLKLDATLKRAVIRCLALKDVRSLNRAILFSVLTDEDDVVRKTMAIKCAQAHSKQAAQKLLDRLYDADTRRYYNVVHWLDLGASMPRAIVDSVSNFELRSQST